MIAQTNRPANIGSFPLKIESCITIYSSGDKRCVLSDEFVITIIDPCPTTTISATGFSTVMSAPQLGLDSLTLFNAIPSGGWPWVTQLDISTGFQYGNDLCGPIDYEVFRKYGTVREETALVDLTPDHEVINLTPGLGDAIGTYDMLLCGKLVNYPTIEWCVPFKVKVTACVTTIVPPAINPMQTVYTMWYDDAIPVDLKPALTGYTQQPNCQYDMVFNVKYEKFPVTFPGTLYSLPAEAIYNQIDQVVYLQKCSALGNPNIQDFECQGSPYEKVQTYVVIASLVGDPQYQTNVDVKFNFVIGDICIHDVMSVSQGLDDLLIYTIHSPAQMF